MWRAQPPLHVAEDILPLICHLNKTMPTTAPEWYFKQTQLIVKHFNTRIPLYLFFFSLQKPKPSRHLRVEAVPMGPPAPPTQSCGPSRSLRAPDPFIEKLHAVDKELDLSPLCMEPYQVQSLIHKKTLFCIFVSLFCSYVH